MCVYLFVAGRGRGEQVARGPLLVARELGGGGRAGLRAAAAAAGVSAAVAAAFRRLSSLEHNALAYATILQL